VNALILIGSILRIQKCRLLCGSDAINSVGGVSEGKKNASLFQGEAGQLAIYMTEQQRRWARIVETTRISVD
jgi:hypothetical protein